MPIDEEQLHHDMVHRKVDNDMESSDLGFSDRAMQVDEHDYQIAELGQFDIDRSMSDVIDGINKEQSVEFSQEFSSDMSRISGHEAHMNEDYSYMSESSAANEVESDYNGSGELHDDEDDWDRFVEGAHQPRYYEPRRN